MYICTYRERGWVGVWGDRDAAVLALLAQPLQERLAPAVGCSGLLVGVEDRQDPAGGGRSHTVCSCVRVCWSGAAFSVESSAMDTILHVLVYLVT